LSSEFFYSLDALHCEASRIAHPVLESLRFSDLMTVLSNGDLPLIVFAPLTFAIIVITAVYYGVLSRPRAAGRGLIAGRVWTPESLFSWSVVAFKTTC